MIAALYVMADGIYSGRPDVDCWPEERDARKYDGPWPVVAHPPCASWCMLAGLREHRYGLKKGDDGGCFAAALRSVRTWGGVLEHPAHSAAWRKFDLTAPRFGSWQRQLDGGWVTEVWQVDYGHRAQKKTWLLSYGVAPQTLRWEARPHTAVVSGSHNHCKKPIGERNRVWRKEASSTPPEFAELLLSIARTAGDCP